MNPQWTWVLLAVSYKILSSECTASCASLSLLGACECICEHMLPLAPYAGSGDMCLLPLRNLSYIGRYSSFWYIIFKNLIHERYIYFNLAPPSISSLLHLFFIFLLLHVYACICIYIYVYMGMCIHMYIQLTEWIQCYLCVPVPKAKHLGFDDLCWNLSPRVTLC